MKGQRRLFVDGVDMGGVQWTFNPQADVQQQWFEDSIEDDAVPTGYEEMVEVARRAWGD